MYSSEVAGSRPIADVTPRRVAGGADRLEQQFHGRLVVVEVRGVAALVALPGAEPALVEDRAERVEALGARAQRLAEGGQADRQEHELLEVDARLRVRTAVEHVEQRHREHVCAVAAEMAVQRDAGGRRGRVARGQAHREDRVGAELGLVRRAVELAQLRVERRLVA